MASDRGSRKKVTAKNAEPERDTAVVTGGGGGDAAPEGPKIPGELPIFPLRDIVAFPFMMFPLVINEPELVSLADEALAGDKMLGLFTEPPDPSDRVPPVNPSPDLNPLWPVYTVGTAAVIHKMLRLPDGAMRLLVQGLGRIRLEELRQREPFMRGRIRILQEPVQAGLTLEAIKRNVTELFNRVVDGSSTLPDELKMVSVNIDDPGRLADFVAANLNLSLPTKQIVLQTVDVSKRLEMATGHLMHELNLQAMHKKIQSEVRSEIDKSQRDYILRQQIKAIQKELGEGDEAPTEIQELEEKIDGAVLSEAALEAARKELDRLRRMSPASAEYSVARNYIDWILQVPWKAPKRKAIDIAFAEKVLNEDHYDLEKVKERILEYLAVRKLKDRPRSPILCLVGPPGVGKTSLGRSIARALGRSFHRLSLGGVHDEAEIRGHRRTYVGAMPGRIVTGLVTAKEADPVFILDEIDKVGQSFRGDPTSALLEVLDPEQNSTFSDHYMNLPVDLSGVLFITTANMLDTIPPPLRDRMEVIDLAGYTAMDKFHIARRYLVPRVLEESGLDRKNLTLSDSALKKIIRSYTMEAGVRNLERELQKVARKVAMKVARRRSTRVRVTDRTLAGFLGPEPFFEEMGGRRNFVGVATGMAWTPVGGTILFIEASRMPGNRGFNLTGQLGDVMRESGMAALSYLRAHAGEFGIADADFSTYDIHVHVPAGAMPKDGPSAGIALFTALASLFLNRPVRRDTAMTGELTLRGQVLPIGGLKQKVLGAHRAGIRRILLPKANEKDLDDIPEEIRSDLEFFTVEDLHDVLRLTLVEPARRPGPTRTRRGRPAPSEKVDSPRAAASPAAPRERRA